MPLISVVMDLRVICLSGTGEHRKRHSGASRNSFSAMQEAPPGSGQCRNGGGACETS